MTQNEVLAMLHKVVAENQQYTTWTVSTPHLVMLVNNAVQAEREACAKECDACICTAQASEAIRARGYNK